MILHIVIFISSCLCLAVSGKGCGTCEDAVKEPVCGSDNKTYPSFCGLMKQECLQDKLIGFECNGECPCDPVEVKKMDKKTVEKLATLRRDIQLEKHIPDMEEENESDDVVTLEILDSNEAIESFEGGEDQGSKQQTEGDPDPCSLPPVTGNCRGYFTKFHYDAAEGTCKSFVYGGCSGNENRFDTEADCISACGKRDDACPSEQMINLPSRLIDWFHVVRANEQEKKNSVEGNMIQPVLKEMPFMDGKLKAMYSHLACTNNNNDIEEEVCLPPVKWMFDHMDLDKNGNLSQLELHEIEEVGHSEHCIDPFLRSCDTNNNDQLVLLEFCKCLCHTPPCTEALESIPTVLINGRAKPMPGMFTPKCDEDGFFMPRQVNILHEEHWCVDRNGNELGESRKNTKEEIHCDVNIYPTNKDTPLIPLDMKKENEPRTEE